MGVKHTDTIIARSADGEEFTIFKYESFSVSKDLVSPGAIRPVGLPTYKTSEGLDVNCLGNGQYEVLDISPKLVTSDDLNTAQ